MDMLEYPLALVNQISWSFVNRLVNYELHQQSLIDVRFGIWRIKEPVVAYPTLLTQLQKKIRVWNLLRYNTFKGILLINTRLNDTSYFDNHPDLLTLTVGCDDAGKIFR